MQKLQQVAKLHAINAYCALSNAYFAELGQFRAILGMRFTHLGQPFHDLGQAGQQGRWALANR
ncbi:MAG: hypothetical protein KUA37_13825 [Desulfomicrobium sp.]|uniref:hypothetical protein n=1 Tax=Hoeflea sp. TaxID=1940281 RepID=UPI0025BAFBC9|nr:hypothetical protein [Hoeflea sp.]MBU4527434.1 hypothetical protein [Alphaproteobacteria bacterium]MBV1713062.1 hypothetical protein [Desulfomicrobium sp.]MBU4543151.1 hypothetical protein [Alphaproteobacteria bacterium]MBU4551842.1 hypothetical protein [Alphaproteobacteria bacterium]MBV1785431.1 hypothetical protein [Hoeflea sp.]